LKEDPPEVRRILKSDRDDILEISGKIWGGHDYLPSVIDEWLADPTCHTYGVEAEGHIVAIGNLRLVDRGKTGWMEGLRVHADHRKKGYAKMLTQHFLRIGGDLGVKRFRYTTGSNNRASIRLANMAGFKQLFKTSVIWHENLKATLRTTRTRITVREATALEVKEIQENNPDLVPQGILIYDWKAVEGTAAGLRQIGKDHRFYVRKNTEDPKSFSFGQAREDMESKWWSFTIYSANVREFAAHFKNHLKMALEIGLDATVCTASTQLEKAFKTQHMPRPRRKMQLIMFEKPASPPLKFDTSNAHLTRHRR
jgi:GNAT superfamily N-acetyltransferase